MYLNAGLHLHELEHLLHVDVGLGQLAVGGAHEAELGGELDKETIDHH